MMRAQAEVTMNQTTPFMACQTPLTMSSPYLGYAFATLLVIVHCPVPVD